jgi:anti-sigma B factor antagonist
VCTDGVAVIRLAGEVDLLTTDVLRAALRRWSTGAGPPRVQVDLAEVTLLDAAGPGTLVRAQRDARRSGADVVVCNAHGVVRRVFEVTGLAGSFGLG